MNTTTWIRGVGRAWALLLGSAVAMPAGLPEDAAAHLKAGRNKEAEAAYSQILATAPNDVGALLGRGRARQALRNLKGATADFDQAVKLAPKNPETWQRRGIFREVVVRDNKGALADYNEVVRLASKSPQAYVLRATVLVKMGQAKLALSDAERAVALKPDHGQAHALKGYSLELLKYDAAALESYEKALQLDPKNELALEGRKTLAPKVKGGDYLTPTKSLTAQVAEKAREYEPPKGDAAAAKAGGLLTSVPKTAARSEEEVRKAQPAKSESPATVSLPVPPAAKRRASGEKLPLPVVKPPPMLAINQLSLAAYSGAVSAAMEGMKLLLAPATEEENAKVEGLWAPAFKFPCAEVVDYLNKLNPPLGQFLAYRTALGYAKAQFDRAQADALYAAAWGNEAAAEEAMAAAHAEAERLEALQQAMQKVVAGIHALGDPPDPEELFGRARKRAEDAENYVRQLAVPEMLRDLQKTNDIMVRIEGDATVDAEGYEFTSNDQDEPLPFRRSVKEAADVSRRGVGLRWDGDTFFLSVARNPDVSKDPRWIEKHTVWGRVSPDGKRLLELKWAEQTEMADGSGEFVVGLANLPFASRSPGLIGTERTELLHFSVADQADRNGLITTKNSAQAIFALVSRNRVSRGAVVRAAPGVRKGTTRMDYSGANTLREIRPVRVTVIFRRDPTATAEAATAMTVTEIHGHVDRAQPQVIVSGAMIDQPAIAARKRLEAEAQRRADELAQAEAKAKQEQIESLKKDIEYIETDLRHLRQLTAGDARFIEFQLEAKSAEIQSKRDLIASLQTGQYVHTRTGFDDRCRGQMIAQCEREIAQMAAIERERRIAERLLAKLEPAERDEIYQDTRRIYEDGAVLSLLRWKIVNRNAYGLWEKRLEVEKQHADQKTQMWEDRVTYAEWTKTGADTAFALVSGVGGFKITGFVYSFGTSALGGGLEKYYQTRSKSAAIKSALFEGTKAVLTSAHDAVDYTWAAVDAYRESEGRNPREKMFDVATTLGMKYATGLVIGVATEQAADYLGKVMGKPAGWKPTGKDHIEAAKFKQQMEWDEALAKDFLKTHTAYRTAVLKKAPEADIARLQAECRRKACSVNASYGAKVYLKYQTLPVQQRAFTQTMREVHDELVPELVKLLRAGRVDGSGQRTGAYGGQIHLSPIRNASSGDSVGIDFDLALHEQPDYLPGPGGKQQRNVWLTKDGKPSSGEELMQDAQKLWNTLYRQRTGYSAAVSFENITSRAHPEAYVDKAWINITKPGHAAKIDPEWAQQAGDVTRFKAHEMQNDNKLLLLHYQRKQEACRGTEKDIRTKLVTLLNNAEKSKGSTWGFAQKKQHEDVKTFWLQVADVMGKFGRGEMDPIEADRRIYLLSGGRGLNDLVDRAGTMIESQGKMTRK